MAAFYLPNANKRIGGVDGLARISISKQLQALTRQGISHTGFTSGTPKSCKVYFTVTTHALATGSFTKHGTQVIDDLRMRISGLGRNGTLIIPPLFAETT